MNYSFAAALLAAVSSIAPAQSPMPSPSALTAHGSIDDFAISRDTTIAHGGRASVRFVATDPPSSFAGIGTALPAAPYEGRRVHVSAQLRASNLAGGGGVVWARADGATPSLAFSTSQATPLLGNTEWTAVEITIDVPRGARGLYFGAFSNGKGTLWIDDVRVSTDDVGPVEYGFEDAAQLVVPNRPALARSPREAARPLSARGLDNTIAFTRLLGYVRFFHPAPEAVRVNWDEFAVRGVRAVESASSSEYLATALKSLFAPIAPAVVIYKDGDAAPPPPSSPSPGAGVMYWQHLGVGTPSGGVVASSQQNIYSSTRVLVPASAVGAPMQLLSRTLSAGVSAPRIPDPARPLQLSLGAGLRASVPVAMYTTDQLIPDSLQRARAVAPSERLTAQDRATRLAAVSLAWGVMQHFYPYHEVAHTDWPAALRTSLTRAATDGDETQFQETLDRMIAALHDGHGGVSSSFVPRSVPDVQLGWAEGKIVVLAVGDSAKAAGLRAGDVMQTVDGRPANDRLAEVSERVSGATPQWVRYVALGRLLAGAPRTSIALGVNTAGAPTREVHLSRTGMQTAVLNKPQKIAELSPGVFYVDLDRINDADFNAALPKLVSATGIVFDMRGYPRQVNTAAILSHLTDTTIHSAKFEVPVVALPDRAATVFTDGEWTLAPIAPRIKAKVAFLTYGGSISYAESTMGVVEEYGLAERVGEPTAGTNGNVNPFSLPGGYTVAWTGMRVTKRNGTPHHGVGVLPTVPMSPTLAGIRAGRDEVLDRAVRVVGGNGLVP